MKYVLRRQEEREVLDGNALSEGDEIASWKEMTAEGLEGKSLLNSGERVSHEQRKQLSKDMTDYAGKTVGWYFETDPKGCRSSIVDIVEEQQGKVLAVLEWVYDFMRIPGQGGGGNIWKEARGVVKINPAEAKVFIDVFNFRMQTLDREMKKNAAFYSDLRDAGLDDATIEQKQNACLEAAGLDWKTMRSLQEDFRATWLQTRNGNSND